MQIAEIPKKLVYAIVFGFTGLIIGIWFADLLYGLGLKNMERVTTIYISLALIILIVIVATFIGFSKGKTLLE